MSCICCGIVPGHEWGGVPMCVNCVRDASPLPTNQLPAHNLSAEIRGIATHLGDLAVSLSGEDREDVAAAQSAMHRVLERHNAA